MSFDSWPLNRKVLRKNFSLGRRRFRPAVETLEDRRMLTFDPSGIEQEMLEYVNRMRMDPAGELERLFLSLDEADPNYFVSPDADVNIALNFFGTDDEVLIAQWASLTTAAAPVVWNSALYDAAEDHNGEMIFHDTQSHQLPGEDGLLDRIVDAGYDWSGSVSVGENVFAYTENVFHGHSAFAIDWGNTPTGIQDPAGHRINILQTSWQEVGISVVASSSGTVGPLVVTQDFGARGNFGDPNVMGVVFTDGDGDEFYDAGEGEAGVTISITDGSNTYTATTMTAGGYQVAVPAGTYDVSASGGALTGTVNLGEITVTTDNVKVDLETSSAPTVTPATISGIVYTDADENGSFNTGDTLLSGVTVFLDADGDGNLDGDEESTTTGGAGAYSFSTTDFGTHTVAFVMPTDMALSPGGVSTHTVTVGDGDTESGLNFALIDDPIVPATISGVAFLDSDENGSFDGSDTLLSDVTVFLDANGDGSLDGGEESTTTDGSGVYSFSTTDFGTHTVAFVMPDDTRLSANGVSTHVVTVAEGDAESNLDFALFEITPATLSGIVYDDRDESGAFNTGDELLSGVVVFLDEDGDGTLDGGEESTTTDGSGIYSFSTADFGTHTIAFVMPDDTRLSASGVSSHTVTVAEGDSESNLDFALFEITPATLSGIVYDDRDESGAFNTGDELLSGVVVFLDEDGDGSLDGGEESVTTDVSGGYSFSTTDFGSHTVAFVMPDDTRLSAGGVSSHTITVADGDTEAALNFALFEITPATLSGIVYDDRDESGFFNTGDELISGVVVFLDADGDGNLDGGEVSTTTGGVGAYSFSTTDFGTHTVAYVMPDNTRISSGGVSSHTVTVGDSDAETTLNFAVYELTEATLSGIVFLDEDEDGAFGGGDTLQSGITVFLDTDTDGVLDGGEQSVTTDGSGAYSFSTFDYGTYTVAFELPVNTAVSPSGVSSHTVTVGDADSETALNFAIVDLIGDLTLDVSGTAGADTITYTENGGTFTVTVNGTEETYTTADYSTINIDGLGNEDTVNLNAGSDNETATIYEGTMTLVSDAGWIINADNFENVNVDLGTGDDDEAYIYDGTLDDDLISHPESGRLISDAYNHYVENYDRLYAYATAGGNDRAYVYDGPTDDRFIGRKDFSIIRGNNFEFYMRMEGFERNFAFSTEGGEDYAFLYDSDADDNFFGRSDYSVMQDPTVSYFNYAQGFDRVFGYANAGGTDSAFLTDGATDDRFYGRETKSILRDANDTVFYNEVENFERVTAYSVNGGDDHAYMFDSDFDDILTSYFDNTTMNSVGNEYYYNARGFDQVVADASNAGNDTAVFYDSNGNDLFFGRDDYGYLSGNGFLNRANGFDEVELNGSNGGTNTLNIDALDYLLTTFGTWR